jgi:glycosyltransferase involved in cell wall biosynthesis
VRFLRICQIVPRFPYRDHLVGTPSKDGYHVGGVEKHAYVLAHELAQRGHDVTVVAAKSPRHDQMSEIEEFSVKRIATGIQVYNSYLPLSQLWRFDPSEYDLIHAHTPVPAIADIVALRNAFTHIPFFLTYHNDIVKSGPLGGVVSFVYNATLGKFLIKNTDIVITTTQSYADSSKLLKPFISRIKVVPNGVDCDVFKPGLDKTLIREKYGIDSFDKLILFVGHLDHYKGCEYLVRALSLIAENIEHIHLLIVGSGPQKNGLRQIAADLHIEDKVTFAGYVEDDELPYIYASADVFVLPSVSCYEGFGIVQLEALSSGKPVVTTTLPGVREVDSEGIATFHVPPEDVTKLGWAITKVLSDVNLAESMGQRGRELALEQYSWPKVVDQIEAIYFENLVKRSV